MLVMSSLVELDVLGRRQWGLVTRTQVLEVMSDGQLRRLQDDTQLVPVHRGVYRLAGAPISWRQRAMAACLAYGPPCAISHRAAAKLWDLEGILAEHPEVTVPPWRDGRRAGILTHRSVLREADVTSRYGIPVTTPARTIIDLSGLLSMYLLARAVDQVHRARLATPEDVAACLRALNRPGRAGSTAVRELLRFRIEHPGVGDSEWADRIYGWLVAGGETPPQRQVPAVVNGVLRILDMAYPERMIAIELDGFDFHGRRHRFDADAARYDELVLAGWLVVRFTAKHSRASVLDRVHRALSLRPVPSEGSAAPGPRARRRHR
jgi:hypothetical protein